MCGIVGYIGKKIAEYELIEGLKHLEYRGYDSAGLAVLKNNQILTTKSEGNISCLEKNFNKTNFSSIGIAHTRWATHGTPNAINAHPHVSENNEWAVVHNGIIENFEKLKKVLMNQNYIFKSETDTEVIPHLLQCFPCNKNIETIINSCNKLKGSFALAILNKNHDDTLFLARRKSPLYISVNHEEVFVASDPICFYGKTKNYYALDDNEFCEAKISGLNFYNSNGQTINKTSIELNSFEENFGKQNYSHFMLKEIDETPNVLKRIILTYKDNCVFDKIGKDVLCDINKIALIGCGTAYHASQMGAKFIENIAKIDSRSYVASEFRYSEPLIDEKTLAIFVSQSGETADTLMAHELAKQKGATTIALTNVLYSTLAKVSDYVLPVCAGPEIAVASTKAYSAQIAVLNMFAKYLSNIKNGTKLDFLNDISQLAESLKINCMDTLEKLSQELISENDAFFIGRGLDYISSKEASLKLKEITYINSQAYPAGELKHGFLALVEKGTFVFVIATNKNLLNKTLNSAYEAAARGAKLIIATPFNVQDNLKNIHAVISLPNYKEDLMPIATILSFQMLSYLSSVKREINPDQPRNLAKSVTVE